MFIYSVEPEAENIKRDDAYEALDKALETLKYIFKIYPYNDSVKEAFETAEKLDITIYEGAYIVLAEKLGTKLVILDRKLCKRLENTE